MKRNVVKISCNGGFTLIELLVVVLIIGILAAVAVPQYRLAVEKAHFAEAVSQVKALVQAEKVYFLANGEYTQNWEDLDISFSGTLDDNVTQSNWYFSLSHVKEQLPYVYAGRRGQRVDQGRWYVIGMLSGDKMYCEAHVTDEKAQKICKTFGQESVCPYSLHLCYELP